MEKAFDLEKLFSMHESVDPKQSKARSGDLLVRLTRLTFMMGLIYVNNGQGENFRICPYNYPFPSNIGAPMYWDSRVIKLVFLITSYPR